MRGIFIYVRDFFHNASTEGLGFAIYTVREDWREWTGKHFAFFHEGWTPRGLFIRVPGTRFETMLEWREVSCGWSSERREGCLEVWCGRLQGTFCQE